MQAGRLRQRITIEKATLGTDGYGGQTETWATFLTVWAAIEPLSGQKLFTAQQANSAAQGNIRIRYQPGIEPSMRVKETIAVSDESLTMTGTAPQAISRKSTDGSQVSSIVVTNAAGTVTYTLTTDYTVTTDVEGHTTITRVGTGIITSGQAVLVDYTYYRIYEILAIINPEERDAELLLLYKEAKD